MAEQRPAPSAAASIYPDLKVGTPDVVRQQREPGSVADAMYPRPQPQPPAPQPKSRDESWRDWSRVDPNWARLVGLVPKGGRR